MKISIIGQGYVGLPLAIGLSNAHVQTEGIEIDKERYSQLTNKTSPIEDVSSHEIAKAIDSGFLSFSDRIESIATSQVVIICVPTPIDNDFQPDLEILDDVVEKLSEFVSNNTLIISESTSYPGTLRNRIARRIQETSSAQGLKFAVAPERVDPGNIKFNIANTPRVVGGIDQDSLDQALSIYQKICTEVVPVSSPEVAEFTKLLENSFRLVNISFINQVAELAYAAGLDIREIIDAAATKPFGFMPFKPGIGIGGHCIPVDPMYLTYFAKEHGMNLGLVNEAKMSDIQRTKNIADKICESSGRSLEILIVGLSYKEGSRDTRESPSVKLMRELRNRGHDVKWRDSKVGEFESEKSYCGGLLNFDCVVLVHGDLNLNEDEISLSKAIFYDATGQFRHLGKVIQI